MEYKGGAKRLAGHFQTGVSYMIPLVTAAGLLASIAVIGGGENVMRPVIYGVICAFWAKLD
ncbi:hypothetical protein [Alkalibaculum bacchi]|uniref:hypothetical protein n=1 Tax=Alkalibaculum bacchi TaxID=645887 RepID=UPI0026EE3BDF|nr:hypothetical protein [Alkalibaculum bacchi]